MKLNKETEHAYLTKADMEEIQSKLTVLSDTEVKKWTSIMKNFYKRLSKKAAYL